jgi:hypothetical protein
MEANSRSFWRPFGYLDPYLTLRRLPPRPSVDSYHQLDPEGEVVLTITHQEKHDNHPGDEFEPISPVRNQGEENLSDSPASESDHIEIDLDEKPTHRFRVSARHLILASSYFRRLLTGPFLEATQLRTQNTVEINLIEATDAYALLIILNILHNYSSKIPRVVTPRTLINIASLVDYFGCFHAIQVWSDIWIETFQFHWRNMISGGTHGSDDFDEYVKHEGGTPMMWMYIFWIFEREDLFRNITSYVMCLSREKIEAGQLPMPIEILG